VWLLGVVVAVGLSTAAVGLIGDRVTDRQVAMVSASNVSDELAAGSLLGTEAGLREGSVDPASTSTTAASSLPGGPIVVPGSPGAPAATATLPAGASAPSVTTAPAPVPTRAGGAAPAPSPTPAAPAAPATTAAPVTSVDEVYALVGGTVAVRCTGTTIELRYATPAAGFGIDGTPKTGPADIDVRFKGDDGESRVRVSCVAGAPQEQIEER